jgi:hypothetical protein
LYRYITRKRDKPVDHFGSVISQYPNLVPAAKENANWSQAAQWMRAGANVAFLAAGAVGWFIVNEAIRKNFELTVGEGILRAAVVVVIGAFAVLLLRESGRHFREADTTEDVALSLKALAPFFSVEEITGASAVDAVARIGPHSSVRARRLHP